MHHRIPRTVLAALTLAIGCASPLDRAEELYRQGALREAVEAWRAVPEDSPDHARAGERLGAVEPELDRMLRRFEKQAAFYENAGKLGEAVLYYRLAIKMDPDRRDTLERVQRLVRELQQRKSEERERMLGALDAVDLPAAAEAAEDLLRLAPYDPAVQIEVEQVQHAIGAEVLHNMELGKRALASGELNSARSGFETVMRLDPSNDEAEGWIGLIEERQRKQDRSAAREQAPRVLRRSLELSDVSPREISAESHYRKGRRAELADRKFHALREYARALEDSVHHLKARNALTRLRRELAPQVPDLYAEGKRYFREDDLQNALVSWERVLLIEPDHTQASESADRARRILSRLEEIQHGGS